MKLLDEDLGLRWYNESRLKILKENIIQLKNLNPILKKKLELLLEYYNTHNKKKLERFSQEIHDVRTLNKLIKESFSKNNYIKTKYIPELKKAMKIYSENPQIRLWKKHIFETPEGIFNKEILKKLSRIILTKELPIAERLENIKRFIEKNNNLFDEKDINTLNNININYPHIIKEEARALLKGNLELFREIYSNEISSNKINKHPKLSHFKGLAAAVIITLTLLSGNVYSQKNTYFEQKKEVIEMIGNDSTKMHQFIEIDKVINNPFESYEIIVENIPTDYALFCYNKGIKYSIDIGDLYKNNISIEQINQFVGEGITEAKAIIKLTKNPNLKELYLIFGISNFQRYSDKVINKIYQSYFHFDNSKKIALVIYNKDDDEGAYNRPKLFEPFIEKYNLFIFETETDKSVINIIKKVAKQFGKIDILVLGGHGTSNSIDFGNTSKEYAINKPKNLNIKSDLDIQDIPLIKQYFNKKSKIFSLACSTGKGRNSFAKNLAEKSGSKVYAPNYDVGLDGFIKNSKGFVKKIKFTNRTWKSENTLLKRIFTKRMRVFK